MCRTVCAPGEDSAQCPFMQSDRRLHLPRMGNTKPVLTIRGAEQNNHRSKMFRDYKTLLCT